MAVEIKRVSYAFNSVLQESGGRGFFLDCFISRDGETLVDTHNSFSTREEFWEAIEELIPVIEGAPDEDRQDKTEDVGR